MAHGPLRELLVGGDARRAVPLPPCVLVRQEGIEPPTYSLEGCCSIQLSYWRATRASRPSRGAGQVGATGFEPVTSCSQSRRDTRLRYAPQDTKKLVTAEVKVNRARLSTTNRN